MAAEKKPSFEETLLERYRATLIERAKSQTVVRETMLHLSGLNKNIVDLQAAARVFDVDLPLEADVLKDHPNVTVVSVPTSGEGARDRGPGRVPDAIAPQERLTVRDFIIREAEKAYPSGVRATELHNKYETETGQKIHGKTIGMSLYRLANEPEKLMRRKGWDWFFVPESERT